MTNSSASATPPGGRRTRGPALPAVVVLALAALAGGGAPAFGAAPPAGADREVRAVLEEQAKAWNAGKLERAAALVPFTALTVDRDTPRFADRVLELTGGAGVNLVLDLVGGRYTAESLACLAPRGRMLLVGTVDGVKSELDLRLALGKRAQITGTVLRARPLEEKMALARAVERHVLPLLARGIYRPVVDRVLPVDQVAEAFEHLVADRNVGKIVLAWSGR